MFRLEYEIRSRQLLNYKLARETGIEKNILSMIRRGRVNPTPSELDRLASALGVPASELMKRVVLPEGEPTTEAVVR